MMKGTVIGVYIPRQDTMGDGLEDFATRDEKTKTKREEKK